MASDLLPSKIEYEIMKEALRTIITPDTTIFADLMDKLFLNNYDEHYDYTFDAGPSQVIINNNKESGA